MNHLSKLLRTSIALVLLLFMSHANSQINEPIQHTPDGFFDLLFDKDGRTAEIHNTMIDYTLPDSKGNNGIAALTTGYFSLHFENGSGFESTTDPVHATRRTALARVFEDISSWITAAPGTDVHLLIRDFSNFADAPLDATSAGSSFYLLPNIPGMATGDIIEGVVAQTIQSGQDPYLQFISPFADFNLPSGEISPYYHGYLSFNFNHTWHLDSTVAIASSDIDLYSVALSEVLGCLGLSSLIKDDGESKLGSDFSYYSNYDKLRQTTNSVPYLVNTGSCALCNYNWNTNLTIGTYINNENNNTDSTIHYIDTLQSGVGSASILRSPVSAQASEICTLGYAVGNSYGQIANQNVTNYGLNCNTSSVLSSSDIFNIDGAAKFFIDSTSVSFLGSDIIGNDINSNGFDCLQSIAGSGTMSATAGTSGTSLTYTRATSNYEYHLFRYAAKNSTTSGNFGYLLMMGGGGGCIENQCQLINNGDFEQFNGSNCSWNNFAMQQCWLDLSGTCDLLSPQCTGFLMEFPTGTVNQTLENNVSGNGGALHILNTAVGTNSYEEACQAQMNQPLVPGETYRLRFSARMASEQHNNPGRLDVAFNNNIVIPNPNGNWNPANFTTPLPFMHVTDNGQWQFYDQTFTVSAPGLDVFMIGLNGSNLNFPNLLSDLTFCIIDDIRLEHIETRAFNLPETLCSLVNINLMSFVSPAANNGEFFINGIGLGAGINQWTANTTGTYNISFTYVDQFHTCHTISDNLTVTQGLDVSFTLSDNSVCDGQTITLTASNAMPGATTYSWAPTNITNPDAGAVVSATFSNSATVTLTGTNGACTDTFSQHIAVSFCTPPVINAAVGQPTCYGLCNGAIHITASNPFTISWSNGTNNIPVISGLCPGTYSATVNMPGFAITTFSYVISYPAVTGTLYNGNLPPITGPTPTDWPNNFNVTCDQDLIISPGATLNMTNGTNNSIKFTPGHGIIIMPGGHLKANFTTFTSTCGAWWKGISCQASSATVRGTIQLNNGCLVEKAIHGIMNHDGNNQNRGGHITCLNMTFRNNDRDIELQSFNATSTDYGAVFRECIFEITAPGFTPVDITEKARVWMHDVGMVYFQGCKFRNLDNVLSFMLNTYHMKAIRAYKSEIYVNDFQSGFGSVQSEIKGFDLGIELVAPTIPCAIYNTDFQCYRGVYCANTDGSRIYNNNFSNISTSIFNGDPTTDPEDGDLNGIGGNEDGSYAVYMRKGLKNQIDANTVNMNQDNNRYGFAFYDNSSGTNVLYDNRINNVTRGVVAWGQNKISANPNSAGLQISCNDFTQDAGIASRNITVDALGSTSLLTGIRPRQRNGSGSSAGNTFTQTAATFDDVFDNTLFGMEYYYHPNDNLVLNEVSINGDPDNTGTLPTIANPFPCSAILPPAGMAPEEIISGFNASKNAISTSLNTKKVQYNNLLDDGETENTLTEVEYATWQNVVELYDELLSKSPALSTEVMIKAIEKENDIPAVILTSILAANPTAAKDEHIRRALDVRMIQLSEVQRAMIDLGISQTSAREEIEWQMAELKTNYDMAKTEALLSLIERGEGEENEEVQAAIHTIMDADITREERYERVAYRIGRGDHTEAIALLNELPNDYPMRGLQAKEYDRLYPLFEVQIALAEGTQLDQSQIDYLEEMKESEFMEAQRMAWSILETEGIYPIQDILYPESDLEPRSLRIKQPDQVSAPALTLYPNPTNDLCIIKSSLSVECGKIVVLDAMGKVVLEQQVPKFQTETFISLGDLAAGLYQVQLLNANSGIVGRASLIKQ